jgi:hypothetical protein
MEADSRASDSTLSEAASDSAAPPRKLKKIPLFWASARRRRAPVRRPAKEPVDLVEHYERTKSLRQYFIQNAIPAASGTIFAFVVLKILLVARANDNTALAIVQKSGSVQIVSGVIILAVPFLASGLNNAAAIWAGSDSKFNRLERRRLWWFFGISLPYLISILPWLSSLLLIAFALFFVIRWVWRRRKVPAGNAMAGSAAGEQAFDAEVFLQTPPDDVELRRLWVQIGESYRKLNDGSCTDGRAAEAAVLDDVAQQYDARSRLVKAAGRPTVDAAAIALLVTVLLPVLQFSLNDSVWLPTEEVSMQTGRPLVGYVLDNTVGWTTILQDSDRKIVTIRATEIKARSVCRLDSQSSQILTLPQLGRKHIADYPRCS